MKTLKTITTALLLLLTVSSFAQTKEETLEWLQQNGNAYLNFYFTYENIGVSYSYKFYEDYYIEEDEWTTASTDAVSMTKIYYKDIFIVRDISSLDTEKSSDNFNPIPTYVRFLIKKYFFKGSKDLDYKLKNNTRFSFKYDADQPNTRKNMDKVLRAQMHIAELSGAEPYKDLFGE